MKGWLLAMTMLFFLSSAHAGSCYISAGIGQSTIGLIGPKDYESELLETEYTSLSANEDAQSITHEFHLGCTLSEEHGLKAELSMFDGLKHTVETDVTVHYDNSDANFLLQRTVRARGYMLSGIWEVPLDERKSLFGRLGAAYLTAEADLTADDSPYSVHYEQEGVVPVVGLGLRYAWSDSWSAALEYRAIGHYDVRHASFTLEYTFSQW
jgi:opacity protein-like surface antigen